MTENVFEKGKRISDGKLTSPAETELKALQALIKLYPLQRKEPIKQFLALFSTFIFISLIRIVSSPFNTLTVQGIIINGNFYEVLFPPYPQTMSQGS